MKTWMCCVAMLFALSGCEDGSASGGGEDAEPADAGGAEDAQRGGEDAALPDPGESPTVSFVPWRSDGMRRLLCT